MSTSNADKNHDKFSVHHISYDANENEKGAEDKAENYADNYDDKDPERKFQQVQE